MRLADMVGHTLEQRITQDTATLLDALWRQAERDPSPAIPIRSDDPMRLIAAQILCQAGLARQESKSPDERIAGWYVITDAGKERRAAIQQAPSWAELGNI